MGPGEVFLRGLSPQDECIAWPWSRNVKSGYGQTVLNGVKMPAHRASALIHIGPPPTKKHHAAHSCKQRECVNPLHLRWATAAENSADKIKHGTHLEGERAPRAKLTEAEVRSIRHLAPYFSNMVLSRKYNVCDSLISQIVSRRIWGHVSDTEGPRENTMDARNKAILAAIEAGGKTQDAIAKDFGVSPQLVSVIKKNHTLSLKDLEDACV